MPSEPSGMLRWVLTRALTGTTTLVLGIYRDCTILALPLSETIRRRAPEIEVAIPGHPTIRSCAVFSLNDGDISTWVHSLIEADHAGINEPVLQPFLKLRLSPRKKTTFDRRCDCRYLQGC